ncbi:MAG: ATP synthase F1 subunit gamma [bacterium]|nr:ATP synthase F1 subunit gamma [bacterium]
MANLRLIKRKIKTTQNIAKITRAMEMVAALKMKRAQDQALRTRPYTTKATQILSNLTRGLKAFSHPLFLSISALKSKKEKVLILLIAPNRGLCGSLTTNLFRELVSFTQNLADKEIFYSTYGRRGRDFVTVRALSVAADFEASEPPPFEKAVDLARVLREGFISGEFQKVYLAYTHFESTMRQKAVVLPLLPFGKDVLEIGESFFKEEEEAKFNFDYLFEPSSQRLLDAFLPHFLEIKIYHAMLEAYASEQSARMMAMRSATENAREIMAELTLSYNKERQQVITSEISDIVTAQLGLEAG